MKKFSIFNFQFLKKYRVPSTQYSGLGTRYSELSTTKGMGLIEILVGATIISIGLVGIVQSYNYYVHIALTNTSTIKASYLLEESAEVMRLLRDQSFAGNIASLSTSNSYYLTYSTTTNKWATSTVNVFVDSKFERKITASSVYRDANNDIAASGTLDSNIRLLTATVSWLDGSATTTKSLSLYVTNIYGN